MAPHVAVNLPFAQMVQHVLWKNTSFAQMTQHVSWLDQFMEPHNTSLSCTQHVNIGVEPAPAKALMPQTRSATSKLGSHSPRASCMAPLRPVTSAWGKCQTVSVSLGVFVCDRIAIAASNVARPREPLRWLEWQATHACFHAKSCMHARSLSLINSVTVM
jgi:hypothetical protein